MNTHCKGGEMDELDRLIERELRALLGRQSLRPPTGARKPVHTAERHHAPSTAQRSTADPPRPDNVVRAHPLARPPKVPGPRHMDGLFAPDEEAFLANAADWLSGRPNADILLEALSRRVLEPDASTLGDEEDVASIETARENEFFPDAENPTAADTADENWGDLPDAEVEPADSTLVDDSDDLADVPGQPDAPGPGQTKDTPNPGRS